MPGLADLERVFDDRDGRLDDAGCGAQSEHWMGRQRWAPRCSDAQGVVRWLPQWVARQSATVGDHAFNVTGQRFGGFNDNSVRVARRGAAPRKIWKRSAIISILFLDQRDDLHGLADSLLPGAPGPACFRP